MHCDQSLWDHWHVYHDTVPLLDSLVSDYFCKPCNLVLQVRISDDATALCEGALIYDCHIITVPCLDMPIDAVVRHVCETSSEPSVKRCFGVVEHAVPRLEPLDSIHGLGPESFPCLGIQ